MCVVNSEAERGVKLGSDFLESAKKEERLQDVFGVVENDRKIQTKNKQKSETMKMRIQMDNLKLNVTKCF